MDEVGGRESLEIKREKIFLLKFYIHGLMDTCQYICGYE